MNAALRFSRVITIATLSSLGFAACGQATGPAKQPCVGDACDKSLNEDGYCTTDEQCPSDQKCGDGGICVAKSPVDPGGCTNTSECAGTLVCKIATGRCVECLTNDNCDTGFECRADNTCGPIPGCATDDQCSGLFCDTTNGQCVECLTTANCGFQQTCADNTCVAGAPECQTLDDCAQEGKVCSPDGECVACTSTPECGAARVCNAGSCVDDVGSARAPKAGELVINEILAEPATGLAGDSNGDGVRDTYDDEFVEITNKSGVALDVTGCTVSVRTVVKHQWTGSGNIIANKTGVVVFGGGNPTGTFGGSKVYTASTGSLVLGNDGSTVSLDCGGVQVDKVTYGSGASGQSWTRNPDGDGSAALVKTLTLTPDTAFTPGTCADGSHFASCL